MGAVSKDGGPPQPNQRIYNAKTGSHMQVTLNRAVQLWPTPTLNDTRPGRDLEKQKERHTLGLAEEARTWPTPMVPNGGRSRKVDGLSSTGVDDQGAKHQVSLESAAKTWATPAARDYRFPNSEESQKRRNKGSKRGQQLPNQVAWPTPRASEKDQGRETQASVRGEAEVKRGPTVTATALSMTLDTGKEQKPQGGGALNPEFVCWLMGYPEGWTDLDR